MVRILLRLEGLALFLASLYFYAGSEASWGLFALLWLVPDVGMLGYVVNARLGSVAYNVLHSEIGGLLMVILGIVYQEVTPIALGLIWLSHVGLDRFLGFGLKYATHFKDTHVQHL